MVKRRTYTVNNRALPRWPQDGEATKVPTNGVVLVAEGYDSVGEGPGWIYVVYILFKIRETEEFSVGQHSKLHTK